MEAYQDEEGSKPVQAIENIVIDEYAQFQSNSTVETAVFGNTYVGKRV